MKTLVRQNKYLQLLFLVVLSCVVAILPVLASQVKSPIEYYDNYSGYAWLFSSATVSNGEVIVKERRLYTNLSLHSNEYITNHQAKTISSKFSGTTPNNVYVSGYITNYHPY